MLLFITGTTADFLRAPSHSTICFSAKKKKKERKKKNTFQKIGFDTAVCAAFYTSSLIKMLGNAGITSKVSKASACFASGSALTW